MIIEKTNTYTLIKPTSNSIEEFFKIFKKEQLKHKEEHLILDFSDKINILLQELLLFLDISKHQINNGMSFVIVANGINIDDVPEEFNVVPTVLEAKDVLEMDAIERELGF